MRKLGANAWVLFALLFGQLFLLSVSENSGLSKTEYSTYDGLNGQSKTRTLTQDSTGEILEFEFP